MDNRTDAVTVTMTRAEAQDFRGLLIDLASTLQTDATDAIRRYGDAEAIAEAVQSRKDADQLMRLWDLIRAASDAALPPSDADPATGIPYGELT
jgi:hypothetical protein